MGRGVSVKLHSGEVFTGVLASIDGYMNVVLEKAKEFARLGTLVKHYEEVFLRGNNSRRALY